LQLIVLHVVSTRTHVHTHTHAHTSDKEKTTPVNLIAAHFVYQLCRENTNHFSDIFYGSPFEFLCQAQC